MTSRGSTELEILFRICARVHATVRQEITSPHRADVVAMGADGSPTEEIDRVAEAQILAALEDEGVSWDLLSEEIGLVQRRGDRVLVADPIDGSHNALRALPSATVALGLGKANLDGIDIGMVHDLITGVTYWAQRGQGAFKDGRPIATRPWNPKSELFFLNLGRHSTPRAVQLAAKGRRIRSLGCASLEISMIAQGGADAYLFENDTEDRNLRVTDIAGAYRILLEAGGGVTDAEGNSIGPMPLELARHTSVFAWGDPEFGRQAQHEGYL